MTHRPDTYPEYSSRKGRLFVISAPSGAGKTTLIKLVLRRLPDMAYSVSHTTRKPRQGEAHGVDYYFISRDAFLKGIQQDLWVEWAEVHGHYYGTAVDTIERHLTSATDVLLDIDVQGADQIRQKYPDSILIFIEPPTFEDLQQRLINRGTDPAADMAERLKNAKAELAQKYRFKHVVVNDRIDTAADRLEGLICRYRSHPHQ